MHLSTLFSNLLVAVQLISLPSFAHGRFLVEEAHQLQARQYCRLRSCTNLVTVLIGEALVLEDDDLGGEVEFKWIAINGNEVGIQTRNTIGVSVRAVIQGFSGAFTQAIQVGIGQQTFPLTNAHWLNWHNAQIRLTCTYAAGFPAQPYAAKAGTKPKKAAGKRDQLGEGIEILVREEKITRMLTLLAVEYETADTPKEKTHGIPPAGNHPPAGNYAPAGKQPTSPNPKAKGQLPYNESKPKTIGGGGCQPSCNAGRWRTECRPRCG